MSNTQTDLTRRPPRSPRVRLGGFAILPRMLDKGRALLAGLAGDYKYACPLDQRFLDFAGIDPEALKAQLAAGLGDGDVLRWVRQHSKTQPHPAAIEAWSTLVERQAPADLKSRQVFNELHQGCGPAREDITTWFDLLDLDDYVSFGGKA